MSNNARDAGGAVFVELDVSDLPKVGPEEPPDPGFRIVGWAVYDRTPSHEFRLMEARGGIVNPEARGEPREGPDRYVAVSLISLPPPPRIARNPYRGSRLVSEVLPDEASALEYARGLSEASRVVDS